ncbi:hypothetical protein BG261_09700 [Floricoccus tropicus]|uniref:BMC domain-containing protein n=1 Tax=Floricoccus tropicus TaxID=1859473 RepID=A0A1E8GNT0_9LACT|nr:BMC domain-containing protein [Floricoccus tropicus]OFI49909.1 hypothetical protein BG261_09700 [Floricoccus tropicus]
MQSLGLIEVRGMLAGIAAADAALKAANVQLLRSEKISGGLTTIELIGDVAAVTAAVEAGKFVAENLGQLRSSHVIARLDPETEKILLDKPEAKDIEVKKTITEKVVKEDNNSISKPSVNEKNSTVNNKPVSEK